ncbi:MAG: pimeloyl-ACP methyl ester carboxylesterase [Myxococcota bacterium]|jgi:pimeloyl-ACP methyl ester carboxylesterase
MTSRLIRRGSHGSRGSHCSDLRWTVLRRSLLHLEDAWLHGRPSAIDDGVKGMTSHRARASGIELHWVEMGKGRPLVLLHGLGDTHRTWRRVMPHLARGRRVLALDLAGHGMSERPEAPYDLRWHAQLVGQWCDYLELDDFDIAGHSFGGGVAQFFLLTHGSKVRRMALVSAGGLGREVHIALRLMALPLGPRVMQPFMRLGTLVGTKAVGRDAFDADERRWLSEMNAQPGSAVAFARTVRGVIGFFGQTIHFLDHAHRIDSLPPMAMFWGEADEIVPLTHGIRAQRYLDHVDLIRFPHAGHFPHLAQPSAFAQALVSFLDVEDHRRAELAPIEQLPLPTRGRRALRRLLKVASGNR